MRFKKSCAHFFQECTCKCMHVKSSQWTLVVDYFFIAHYSSLFPPFPSFWLSLGYLIFTHCFRLLFTFSLRHVMYTSRIPWALFLILPFTLPCLLSFNISVFTCLLPRTPSFLPHLDFQCHLIWNWLFFGVYFCYPSHLSRSLSFDYPPLSFFISHTLHILYSIITLGNWVR